MYESLIKAFHDFPDEANIVGRLLAGHGQLEVDLMNCVTVARRELDATLKTMFRARGETRRIKIAEALASEAYGVQALGADFELAVNAVRHCLQIRNQYAHCTWYNDYSGMLAFVNLEELAKQHATVTDLRSLTIHHVDVPLLGRQEAYFAYASASLVWVNFEGRYRDGRLTSQLLAKRGHMEQSPLYLP
jgi:hypothetical protein